MITIKMNNEKWRLAIGDEVWEFETKKEMMKVLEQLIDFKEKYGKITRC